MLGWLYWLTSLFLKLFFSANTRLLHQQNSLSCVAVNPETVFSNAYLKCLTPKNLRYRPDTELSNLLGVQEQLENRVTTSAIFFVRKAGQRLNTISMSKEQSLSRKKDRSDWRGEHFFRLSGFDDLFCTIFRELAKVCY